MNKTKSILYVGVALVTFFTASLVLHRKQEAPQFTQPKLPDMTEFVKGIQPVMGAETDWSGVRSIATLARSINTTVESFLASLASTGALSRTASYTFVVPTASGNFNAKLAVNGNFSVTRSHSGGAATFSHGFIMCKVGQTTPAIQLFFDSTTSAGADDGTVFLFRPSDFSSTVFVNGQYLESTLTGSTGSRRQITTWGNGPMGIGGPTQSARIIVDEINSGAQLTFKASARTNTGTNPCGSGNAWDYYGLAFIVNTAAPNSSTAIQGIHDVAPPTAIATAACNLTSTSFNYATFNSGGYLNGPVTAGAIPAGFPSAADVDALFAQLNTGDLAAGQLNTLAGAGIAASGSLTCP